LVQIYFKGLVVDNRVIESLVIAGSLVITAVFLSNIVNGEIGK
jgi:hypothetical protein